MLMAIFVLALIGTLGVALLFTTQVEVGMSKGSLRLKQAFFLAEAAQEHGRGHLYDLNGLDDFSPDLKAHAGADLQFNASPQTLGVTWDANDVPTALTGYGDDTPLIPITPFGDGWYAAFVTNDPAEGWTTTDDSNDMVMITGIGMGPDRAVEIVQAIVLKEDLFEGLSPATITLFGPTPNFWGGSSDVHDYKGDDCDGSGTFVPVVGTIGEDAELAAEQGIKYDEQTGDGPDYESGGYYREDTFADLTDSANEPTMAPGSDIDSEWLQCEHIREIVDTLRTFPDAYCCNPPNCDPAIVCNMPPDDIGNLLFVDGDYEVGPEGGMGTLVVTGEVRYDGKADWAGQILAFGKGEFIRKGAGNGSITGGIMVADIAGPDNIYGTADDCTGPDNGFDSVLFDLSGGGNADTYYCSDFIIKSKPEPPYQIVNFRQY